MKIVMLARHQLCSNKFQGWVVRSVHILRYYRRKGGEGGGEYISEIVHGIFYFSDMLSALSPITDKIFRNTKKSMKVHNGVLSAKKAALDFC